MMGAPEVKVELPAGTVTFLFSDIERSTQNVSFLGDERYAELQEWEELGVPWP